MPTSIDGTDITSATIDGEEVQEITVDGDIVFKKAVAFNQLIAWWELNGDTTDSSGNNNDAVNNGATIISGYNQNEAYDFDGLGDFMDTPVTDGVDSYTLTYWLKTTDASKSAVVSSWSSTNNEGIVTGVNGHWSDGVSGHINNGIRYTNGNANNIVTDDPYDDDVWHFVAAVRDKSISEDADSLSLYVDGVSVPTSVGRNQGSGNTPNNEIDIALVNSQDNYFDGSAQDIRLYDRPLTASEVSEIYTNKVGTTSWDEGFEDDAAGTVPDGWSNTIHGSNGEFQASNTRSTDGSISGRNRDPNTGSPSHSHAQTSRYAPVDDHTISFDYYVDGNKNNSGSADAFYFSNQNRLYKDGDENHSNNYEFSWRLETIQNGSSIDAFDGNGDGTSSSVTLESAKFDQWVSVSIEVEYSNNRWFVDIDNNSYGPFGFINNGRGIDFPFFHNHIDNYTGWFDNITVN